nr:unnamed protein product [Callosobruchus chinensis]
MGVLEAYVTRNYARMLRNVCIPELPENKTYIQLITLLAEHFAPVKSYFAERLKLFTAKRTLHETVSD